MSEEIKKFDDNNGGKFEEYRDDFSRFILNSEHCKTIKDIRNSDFINLHNRTVCKTVDHILSKYDLKK